MVFVRGTDYNRMLDLNHVVLRMIYSDFTNDLLNY